MNPYRLRAYILLFTTSVIWGIAGPIIKFTLGGISPLLFLTYRFGLASIFAVLQLTLIRFKFPKDLKTLLTIFIYAFLTSTVCLGFLFLGLEKTTVLDMELISLIGPLLIVLTGVVFLNERVTLREKIGISIALLGTLLTIIEPVIKDGGAGRISGNILIVLYLIANAFSALFLKKLLRENYSALALTNLSFIVGFVTLTPLAYILVGPKAMLTSITNLSLPYHLGVIFMAFISGTLAYTLGNKGQKTIEIGEAALFSYLTPIFAAPLAVFWLKEKITPIFVIGAIVIVLGVIIAEYKKKLIA